MEHAPIIKLKHHERQQILDLLLKRVNAFKNNYRQNIAILGHQGVGKTRLIFDLLSHCKSSEIIPIYLDLKPQSIKQLTKNFVGTFLYQYLKITQENAVDNLEYLMITCKDKIPKTIQAIKNINTLISEKASENEIYTMLFDLPQTFYEETSKMVILILDEFHNLEQFELDNPYRELSNKIMVQKHTMYIVISSSIYTAQNILSKKLSLLFGNFEVINLQPFETATASEFITSELGNFTVNENIKNFLVFFTGGYPFYLNVILDQIKCACLDNNQTEVNEKNIFQSIEEAMYKDHGILNQYFNNKYHVFFDTKHTNLYPQILLAIAQGKKKPSQIGACLNKKTPEINRYLNKLIQSDVINKKGVFNSINDPLLVYWLKFVFYRKQNSFNKDIYNCAAAFEGEINGLYEKFCFETKKNIGQRLKELFELFENDIIELDNKRFMLTHFDEIDITDNNNVSLLNARRLKKRWLCCVEKNFIDESRIGTFLIKAKNKDCLRKIVIALDGIDVNARLKALEGKVWIWDQKLLNELFTLFEKPRFIK